METGPGAGEQETEDPGAARVSADDQRPQMWEKWKPTIGEQAEMKRIPPEYLQKVTEVCPGWAGRGTQKRKQTQGSTSGAATSVQSTPAATGQAEAPTTPTPSSPPPRRDSDPDWGATDSETE